MLPGLPLAHGVLRMVHPAMGELRLAYETLDLPADDDQRLVVHLPADAAATAALDRGGPPPRRAACRARLSGVVPT